MELRERVFRFEIGGRYHYFTMTTTVIARTATEAVKRLRQALESSKNLGGRTATLHLERNDSPDALITNPVIQINREQITVFHIAAAHDRETGTPLTREEILKEDADGCGIDRLPGEGAKEPERDEPERGEEAGEERPDMRQGADKPVGAVRRGRRPGSASPGRKPRSKSAESPGS